MAADFNTVMDYLRRICSAREYASKDILQKALARLESPDEAAGALETLQREGYQSDLRYASAFCRDKSAIAGWGPYKIRYQLSSKGISKEIIDTAMGEIDSDKAVERLRRALSVKREQLRDDPQLKLKLLKFGLSRGYSYEEVQSCLDSQRER